MIKIVDYDPEWSRIFKEEANRIKQALGLNCATVVHIGSTAVPGLAAKPIIDLIPIVKNILTVDSRNEKMAELGFEAKGEAGVPFRRFFKKVGPISINAHVYEKHNPEIDRHLRFRDYLREHPDEVKTYSELKRKLANDYPDDMDAYGEGKDYFIHGIDAKSGFDGMRVIQVRTNEEHEAYKELMSEAPHSVENNFYFVLRQGVEIVAAAHVIGEDIIQIMVKPNHVNDVYEDEMSFLLERWIDEQTCT